MYLQGVVLMWSFLSKESNETVPLHTLMELLFKPLGTPLFAKQSEFNHREFGYVIPRVLLPMALDYHIRSREIDVNDTAAEELSNLNGGAESKNTAIRVRFIYCLARMSLYSSSL